MQALLRIDSRKCITFRKPDCDNFAKMVLDALNGVAYLDDSQCIKLSVRKGWTHGELNEGAIFIEINEIEY